MTEQIEREIDRLRSDFDRLPAVACHLRSERQTIYSRFENRRTVPEPRDKPKGAMSFDDGLEIPPERIQSSRDLETAPKLFSFGGVKLETANGEPYYRDPGWKTLHVLFTQGSDSDRELIYGTINRASQWVKARWDLICPLLFPGKVVHNIGDRVWCDVVIAAAEVMKSATLQRFRFSVQVTEAMTVSLGTWEQRKQWDLLRRKGSVFGIGPEIEAAIGNNPEDLFTESESLLADSLEVLKYLKQKLCDPPRITKATREPQFPKEYAVMLKAYNEWKDCKTKATGRKRFNTNEWFDERKSWPKPVERFFRKLCKLNDQIDKSEKQILATAIKTARKQCP